MLTYSLVKHMDTNIGEEFNGLLSKMFDLSSRLNLHFFAMYGMVHRFEEKETNNVKKYNITKLRKAMEKELNQYTENAKSINENRCADAWINSEKCLSICPSWGIIGLEKWMLQLCAHPLHIARLWNGSIGFMNYKHLLLWCQILFYKLKHYIKGLCLTNITSQISKSR